MRKYLVNQDLLDPVEFRDCLKQIDEFYIKVGSCVFLEAQSFLVNFVMPIEVDEGLFDGEDAEIWRDIAIMLLHVDIISGGAEARVRKLNLRLLILLLRQMPRILYELCQRFVEEYQKSKFGHVYSAEEFAYKVQYREPSIDSPFAFVQQSAKSAFSLARHVAHRVAARFPPIEELLSRHGELSFLERFSTIVRQCCELVGESITAMIQARLPAVRETPDYAADLRLRTLYRIIFAAPLTNATDAEEVIKRRQLYALLSSNENLADMQLECVCKAYANALECESFLEVVNMVENEPEYLQVLAQTHLQIDYQYSGTAFRTLFGEFKQNALEVIHAIGTYFNSKMVS